jgi:hypothetical protein
MAAFNNLVCGRSWSSAAVLLLAVVGTSYVAEALVDAAVSSRRDSASFVKPATATEPRRDSLPGSSIVAPPVVDWSQAEGGHISQPRECDMAQGISTECTFMD